MNPQQNQTIQDKIENAYQEQSIDKQYNVVPTSFHSHNNVDSSILSPAVALSGFPVKVVDDATVEPTNQPTNGTFIFQVDTSPAFYLWAHLLDPSTNSLIWKKVHLT